MDILFALLVILGPVIVKSIKEKKTVEEKRKYTPYNRSARRSTRRPIRLSSVDYIDIEEVETDNIEEVEIDRSKIEREYEELKSKVEEISVDSKALKSKIQLNHPKKTSKGFNKLTKEDILRGIVLKEVLSEPKCMQNRMR